MSSTEGARALQETLHILLSRLAATMEHVKNWKGFDDASVHVTSTSKLLDHVYQVIAALQRVEGTVKADKILLKSLNECQIPLDLLDLLDSSKLNPDCFCRGLLREALGQLAGLRRRKLALEMLGAAVQNGIALKQRNDDDKNEEKKRKMSGVGDNDSIGEDRKKRPRSSEDTATVDNTNNNKEDESLSSTGKEPATKRQHVAVAENNS